MSSRSKQLNIRHWRGESRSPQINDGDMVIIQVAGQSYSTTLSHVDYWGVAVLILNNPRTPVPDLSSGYNVIWWGHRNDVPVKYSRKLK